MTLIFKGCICLKNCPFIAEMSFFSVIYDKNADFIPVYRPQAWRPCNRLVVSLTVKRKKAVGVENGLNLEKKKSQAEKYWVGRSTAPANQPQFFVIFHKAKAQDGIISPQIVSLCRMEHHGM